MEIDGKNMGTSSIGRGLARHRMGQRDNAKQASDKAAHPDMPGGSHSDHDHGGQEGGHEQIQQMYSEHGPAHIVETKKQDEHHSVTTTHEDGHTHTSNGHPSVSHVHEHIGHSIGGGGETAQEQEGMSDEGAGSLSEMGLGEEG